MTRKTIHHTKPDYNIGLNTKNYTIKNISSYMGRNDLQIICRMLGETKIKKEEREREASHLLLGEMTATTTEISSFFPPMNLFPTSLALRANGTSSTSVSTSSNDEVAAGE